MSSLRLSSAFARRSLHACAPPRSAPLYSSAVRFSSLSSSTSSVSSTSSSSFSTSAAVSRPQRTLASSSLPASSRWSGVTSFRLNQSRTMATEGTKIKVKNPVVELDGDEVGFLSSDLKFEFDLQLDRLLPPVLYITFAGFHCHKRVGRAFSS